MRNLLLPLVMTLTATSANAEYLSISGIVDGNGTIHSVDTPPPSPRAVLGQGFDISSNSLRADCVAENGHDHEEGVKGVALIDIEHINTVSDMQAYDKATSDSLGFDFTYKLFSAGLEDSSHNEDSFNSVNEVARIYRRIVTLITSRNDGVWVKEIGEIVDRDLSDPKVFKEFTEVCGTHFVSAVYRGDIADLAMRFNLKKEKYTAEGKTGFDVGLKGIFSLGYSDTEAEAKVKEHSDLQIIKTGDQGLIGKNTPDPQKPGGVLAAASFVHTEFANQVADAEPTQSAVIGIEITPYWRTTLPGKESFARWHDDAALQFRSKAGPYADLLSVIGDIKFAQSLSDTELPIFYVDVRDTLAAKLDIATTLRDDFQAVMKKCYDSALGNDENAAKTNCGEALKATLPADRIRAATPKHT